MKKLVFAILMCVAAMSAKAQVLTSETVNNVYEDVSNKSNSELAFNAMKTGKDITAMFVYKKELGSKGMLTLKPHRKHEYAYAADGMLTSRTDYRWSDSQKDWICAARYDYSLANGEYCTEYSRYNQATNSFEKPVEKMVYSLMPYDGVDFISYYLRNNPASNYQLVSETLVKNVQYELIAEK